MWQYKEEAEERREHSEERAGMSVLPGLWGGNYADRQGLVCAVRFVRCFTSTHHAEHQQALAPTPTAAAAAAAVAAAAHPRAASLATPYRCVHTAVLATPTLSCRPCGASQDHDLGCGYRPEPARAGRLRGCVGGDLLAVLNH